MIETKVPMDIRVYKTKVIGPFTARQLVCIAIAAVLDIVIYSLVFATSDFEVQNLIYVFLFLDVPILIFSVSVKGMPMEKYIMQVLIPNFLAPTKRKAVITQVKKEEHTMTKKEIKQSKKKAASYARKDKKYKAYQ